MMAGPPAALDLETYRFADGELLTPALAIYPDIVRHNIACMIGSLENDPRRWRPHLKTVKLASMIKLLVDAGVTSAKCATTLELLAAVQAGMVDVLVAYPHTGQNAKRIAAIAAANPAVRIAAIVESEAQVSEWAGTSVGLFIDINPGMNRTGIERDRPVAIRELARNIQAAKLEFRGLHFYDGNSTESDLAERTRRAQARYAELLAIVSAIEDAGIAVHELITAGTPALPCAIGYPDLWNGKFRHQVSPGTVVYNDSSSIRQVPESFGLQPAVVVLSTVVSHPTPGVVTCNAGHKSVSVDSGVPNCIVLGEPSLRGLKPSEEHLPFEVLGSARVPAVGETLYLIPRHVCPTVNNFDFAALIENGRIASIERVTARGHEGPR
jgi:D-serine deaminase-like pyridoxal phosphate-dependent protein